MVKELEGARMTGTEAVDLLKSGNGAYKGIGEILTMVKGLPQDFI